MHQVAPVIAMLIGIASLGTAIYSLFDLQRLWRVEAFLQRRKELSLRSKRQAHCSVLEISNNLDMSEQAIRASCIANPNVRIFEKNGRQYAEFIGTVVF